ncbi:hypothetical protein ANO11243_014560 [Dothideomycetidae sp. 11243]|nr:hypothetical protein ANO11243_014560 [fungal sp. No.11243]
MRSEESSSDGSSAGPVIFTPQDVTETSSPPGEPVKSAEDGKSSDIQTDGNTKSSDQQGEELVKLDPKLVGMSSGLKHLYSGKEDKKGRFQWQPTIPDDVGKPAEDAETQKWALIVRHIKVYNDPEKVLTVHSIVIQSPLLKDLLKGVLKGYPGVTVGLQRLEFSKNFEPLIHRWPQLKAAIEELRKKVAENEAKSLKKAEKEPDTKESNADAVADTDKDKSDTQGGPTKADHSGDTPAIQTAEKPAEPSSQDTPEASAVSTESEKKDKPTQDSTSSQTDATSSDSKKVSAEDETVAPAKKAAKSIASTSDQDDLKALDPEQQDALKLQHAELLYNLLVSEFQDLIDSSQDMMAKGVMTYEHVWTLFQPASLIFSKVEGQERVFRLVSGKYGFNKDNKPGFWLMMLFVEYDGSRFGYQRFNVFLHSWTGTRTIFTLAGFPLEFHREKDELRNKLIARGAKVEALSGSHYRGYEGMGWRRDLWGHKEKFSIKGRIMVDTHGWNKNVPNYSIFVTPFNRDSGSGHRSGSDDSDCESDSDEELGDFEDDMEDGMPIDGHFADDEDEANKEPLTEEQRLMCNHLIRGYALKQKQWLNLYVNSVHELSFNTRAFESLVLPESQKELILGFTSSQQSTRHQFDDVIEGKGRGIILLLCGPPGVGKTLTAESVAEEMRVPLFVMSAGDVGYDSNNVEGRLLDLFEMVTRWNAILLLDEADVFLEERSLHEIERNKIVSIFLRVLEYYEGIMFLTTNRVQTLDQAFQSRIHISLDYPELSIESRKQVWKNFLSRHNVVQLAARERGPPKSKDNKVSGAAAEVKDAASAKEAKAESAAEVSKPVAEEKPVEEKSFEEKPVEEKPVEEKPAEEKPAEEKAEGDASEKVKDLAKTEEGTSKDETTSTDASSPATPPSSSTKHADAPAFSAEELARHEKITQPHCISDRDVDALARMQMNGRQIKNVLKTAQLLAQRRGEGLSKKHIQTVLDVTQHLHNSNRETERSRSAIFC